MDVNTANVVGIVVLMIVAGILGSYCRKIFEEDSPTKKVQTRGRIAEFLNVVIPGIVASFVVPLFLSIGKSDVFTNVIAGEHYAENSFIIFAFCLLAAVSSRSFVNALAEKAFQKAEQADKKAEQADLKADEAKDLASEEPRIATSALAPQAPPVGPIQGTDQEKLVWKSLTSGNFVRRSITGIAKETKLDKADVRNILQNLVAKDLVVEAPSVRTGGLLYQAKLKNVDAGT